MGINVKGLPLIGQGSHGKVYKLDDHCCIKVCNKAKHIQLEFKVLKHSEKYPHFPRVYECKDNYMIREYFDGPNAKEYIRKHGLNRDIAKKLIEIIDMFKELGYTRLDCRLGNIIVTRGEELKIIDPTRNMDKLADYPRKMLTGLAELNLQEEFLNFVKELRPEYYEQWKDKLAEQKIS